MSGHQSRPAAFVAPLLLAVIATVQMLLASFSGLTPWKGGGFGMFASLDHPPFRGVDIIVEAADRSETIAISASLELAAARAAAHPSDLSLTRLARAVVARERRNARPVETVRLTVWRHQFDPATLRATERPFRTFSYRTD